VAGYGNVTLFWAPPLDDGGDPPSSYTIYRMDLENDWGLVGNSTGTTFFDGNVTNGAVYYFRVSAVNAFGEGNASEQVMVIPGLPLAPRGLLATISVGNVQLNWTAPADDGGSTIIDYKIYRGEGSGLFYLSHTSSAALTYLDATVTPGNEYHYRVSAVTERGEGTWSEEAMVILPATSPEVPVIDFAVQGNDGVLVVWHMPVGSTAPTTFLIYRGATPDSMGSIAIVDGDMNEYLDVAGTAGMYYALRSSNQYGVGNLSEVFLATLGGSEEAAIPAPSYLLATVGNGSVTLTWDPMTSFGVDGFRVFRSEGGNFTLLSAQPGSTYVDTGLVNGVTYTYRVYAFIDTSDGENASVEATPGTMPGAPTLNGQEAVDRITLGWSVPENGGSAIVGYRLYRTPGTGMTVLLASLTATGCVDTTVLAGVNYTYMVTALNAFGEGSPSNTIVLRINTEVSPNVDVPAEPYLSTVTGGNASITLLWNVPSDTGDGPITGYNVYRGTGPLTAELLVSVPAGTMSYMDGTAVYGTTYYYWVSALNQWGESELSRMLSASLIALAVPGEVVVDVEEGQGRITLTWSVPNEGSSSITEYRIYRRGETGDRQLIATVPADTDTFVDGSVEVGLEYDYWVTAVNAAGEGPLSDTPVSGVPLAVITGVAEPGPLPIIAVALGAIGLLVAVVAVVLVLRKK